IGHDRQPAEIRNNLAQKFESLTSKISVLDRESGDVPARVSQTRDETGANRVRCRREDYRDDRCCPLCRENYWGCICDNDIDFKSDELGSELGGPIAASLRPAILDDEVATLGPAEVAQPLQKSSDPTALGCGHRYRAQEPDGGQLARLLRARCERPPCCRAAQCEYELSPSDVDCHATPPVGGRVHAIEGTISRFSERNEYCFCAAKVLSRQCLSWVNSVDLAVSRSCPVCP